MNVESVNNERDNSIPDLEDISKIHDIEYGNEVLHPIGSSIDVSRRNQDGSPVKVQIRYATVFFEPQVGANSSDPPFRMTYNIVKKQIDRVTFKYDLSNWICWYAMRSDDWMNSTCYYGGTTCIMTQIPYATYDLEKAKELIISYVTEVLALINQKYAVVYFDTKIGFGITCNYDDTVLEYGVPKLVSTSVEDITDLKTASCVIDTDIKTASLGFQSALDKYKNPNNMIVPTYFYMGSYPLIPQQCIMVSVNHMNHGKYNKPINKFEKSIKEELELSNLNFNKYTLI